MSWLYHQGQAGHNDRMGNPIFQALLNPEPDTLTRPDMDTGQANQRAIYKGQNDPILIYEVRKALDKAKSGTATGLDELPCEVLKNDTAIGFLHKLCYTCFEEDVTPTVWAKGIINPIPKNDLTDPMITTNYRGIILAS